LFPAVGLSGVGCGIMVEVWPRHGQPLSREWCPWTFLHWWVGNFFL